MLIDTSDMETKKRIFERFRHCPRLVEMDETTGRYNIIMRAMAPSLKELQCFLNSSWLKRENLNKFEVYFSSNNVKPKFLPLPLIQFDSLASSKAPCGMRCHLCDNYKGGDCPGCPATDFILKSYSDFLPK